MTRISESEAVRCLRECTDDDDAEFRPQQWDAIDRLANDQERLLIVQRTGWGKSIVYFITTKALRDHGAGPTLVISPLLSLMRNQIDDAEADLGLDVITINSNNTDEWENAKQAVRTGDCDLLLISPERLANRDFQKEVLEEMEQEIGMLVIDEAHCISDWGHDFRPDYRRIRDMVERLPDDVPIAATTATANDRVVDDITEQIPRNAVSARAAHARVTEDSESRIRRTRRTTGVACGERLGDKVLGNHLLSDSRNRSGRHRVAQGAWRRCTPVPRRHGRRSS